ncbi:MAG: hypothetical protein AMK72_08440 [Planctomycetes bacterium SM23_25]|nr:MAG: hypothetical protein AMK72_08440 [Planctomycetes bacterium SM23_25]
MKRINLVALLVGLVAIALVSQDAFARGRMYHPGLGVFMQRDPVGTPLAPPMARNLSGSQFTQRDPTGQYRDGPNLYQYVGSNPVNRLDPSGQVMVIMAGAHEGFGCMEPLMNAVGQELAQWVAEFDASSPNITVRVQKAWWGPLWGFYDGVVRNAYRDWVERRKDNPCSLEQFIAIGHSSGASGIYNVLRQGVFAENGEDKRYRPVYLGLIDMVLHEGGDPDVSGRLPGTYIQAFRQNAHSPKGKYVNGANLNLLLTDEEYPGISHYNIMKNPKVIEYISGIATYQYYLRVKEEVAQDPSKKPWRTAKGKDGW